MPFRAISNPAYPKWVKMGPGVTCVTFFALFDGYFSVEESENNNLIDTTMSGDTRNTDWESQDLTDPTDRSLITDISETLALMSSEKRALRRSQKLREELVREHIESSKQSRSTLGTLIGNLFKSKR